MVTIGWKAGIEQYQPDDLLKQAEVAEQAGFSSIDVSDHFHPWSESGSCGFTWTWLGAAVAKTTTIELGTGLTCPIIRYNPAVIAQAAATVGYMMQNRSFYLGVGTGEALNEYPAAGIWPGYAVRQKMLKEAISLIRLLWSGKEITFPGEFYKTKKARLFTLPKKNIPIYISSLVPNSAYFAGKYGDGLLTVGGQKREYYKEIIRNFTKGAESEGKDAQKMPKLIEVNVAYSDDKQKVLNEMKRYWAGTFVPALFDQKIYTPKMSETNGEAVGFDTIEQKMCISRNADVQVKYLKQYIDAGFTHIYVHFAGPDQIAFIRDYGKDVLPKLHKH